jgi:hypothetical protein
MGNPLCCGAGQYTDVLCYRLVDEEDVLGRHEFHVTDQQLASDVHLLAHPHRVQQ